MKVLFSAQRLPISIDQAWEFFSDPANLSRITPEEMSFNIITDLHLQGEKMYPGMIIAYKITPFFKLRMNWVTEITHVKEKEFFVDNQKTGPFKIWHHQHRFKEVEGGVEMIDILHYAVPFGIFGALIERIFIEKRVNNIFFYRKNVLKEMFGKL